jgi:hypothetical protein
LHIRGREIHAESRFLNDLEISGRSDLMQCLLCINCFIQLFISQDELFKMGVLESPYLNDKPDEDDEIWKAKEWKDVEKILIDRKPQLKHEYVPETDSQITWVLKEETEKDDVSWEHRLLVSSYGCNNLLKSSQQLSEFESTQGDEDEEAVKKKRKENSAIAQKLFKPADKAPSKYEGQNKEKTNHVANYVTNKWPVAALESLQNDPPRSLEGDVRAEVIISSFRFITSSWVIDKPKKLEVLKDKQGLDWLGLVDSVLSWVKNGKKKGSEKLLEVAEQTKKHLDGIMAGDSLDGTTKINKTPESTDVAQDTTKKPAVTSEAEKEAIRVRRESMRARMRGSATSLASLAAVPAPAPAPVPLPAPVVPSRPTTNVPKPPRWKLTATVPPPPPVNPVPQRAPSPVTYQQTSRYEDTRDLPYTDPSINMYGTAQPLPPPPPPLPIQDYSSDWRPPTGGENRFQDVGEKQTNNPPYQMGTDPVSSSFQNPAGQDGYPSNRYSQVDRSREDDFPPHSVSEPDQQWGKRSRWGEGGGGNNGRNNKRSRADPLPPNDGRGGGGGRGRGRGVDLTKPAWMTNQDSVNGYFGRGGEGAFNHSAGPGSSSGGAGGGGPPQGGRPAVPIDDAGLGRGRGRGRTLPAWMTNQS